MKSFYQSSIIALIVVILLVGCQPEKKQSKLLKEVITKDNITDIFKKLRDDKDFRTRDFEFFTNGMTRLVTQNADSLIGKTVGSIIESQDNFERDQMAATAANQATKVELVLNHAFSYIGFQPSEVEDKDHVKKPINIMVYDVTNKSDKEMTNIEGTLQFYGPDNQIVKIYPLITSKVMKDESIKPGETKRFAYPFDFDPNNERDQKIRTNHKDLRPMWICTKIEFKDGSQISVGNTL